MKQFNIQEYLENPNRKIVTRDRRNARIASTNGTNDRYPIIALIHEGNKERVEFYTNDGRYIENKISDNDLFFAPEKKSGWINLYKINSTISPGPRAYDTKEEAESSAGDKSYYISTIKIEWEE